MSLTVMNVSFIVCVTVSITPCLPNTVAPRRDEVSEVREESANVLRDRRVVVLVEPDTRITLEQRHRSGHRVLPKLTHEHHERRERHVLTGLLSPINAAVADAATLRLATAEAGDARRILVTVPREHGLEHVDTIDAPPHPRVIAGERVTQDPRGHDGTNVAAHQKLRHGLLELDVEVRVLLAIVVEHLEAVDLASRQNSGFGSHLVFLQTLTRKPTP